jgi:hypothetical protein
LEYASADLAHPFAREIANLARAVAKAAEEGKEGTMRSNPPPVMSRPEADDLNQDTQMNAWYKVSYTHFPFSIPTHTSLGNFY